MSETFKPMGDRVVVRRSTVATKNGVVVPEKYASYKDRGVVLAVGPGRPGVPMTLKVDDRVLLDKNAPTQTTLLDDEEVLILYEAEIAGKFE